MKSVRLTPCVCLHFCTFWHDTRIIQLVYYFFLYSEAKLWENGEWKWIGRRKDHHDYHMNGTLFFFFGKPFNLWDSKSFELISVNTQFLFNDFLLRSTTAVKKGKMKVDWGPNREKKGKPFIMYEFWKKNLSQLFHFNYSNLIFWIHVYRLIECVLF